MIRHSIPLWLKIGYSIWILTWVPTYWIYHGPANLLWLCDVANFFVAAAIWFESPLLFSSQAVSVLLIQVAWMIDYFGRMLLGLHPIGGTEYMFDGTQPYWVRSLSLFHIFIPILLIWAIWRVGYDRHGWQLQTAIAWLILPLSYVAATPEKNLNWLWAPFGISQTLVSPPHYLLFCMFAYPVVIFWTTHRLLLWWFQRRHRSVLPAEPRG